MFPAGPCVVISLHTSDHVPALSAETRAHPRGPVSQRPALLPRAPRSFSCSPEPLSPACCGRPASSAPRHHDPHLHSLPAPPPVSPAVGPSPSLTSPGSVGLSGGTPSYLMIAGLSLGSEPRAASPTAGRGLGPEPSSPLCPPTHPNLAGSADACAKAGQRDTEVRIEHFATTTAHTEGTLSGVVLRALCLGRCT